MSIGNALYVNLLGFGFWVPVMPVLSVGALELYLPSPRQFRCPIWGRLKMKIEWIARKSQKKFRAKNLQFEFRSFSFEFAVLPLAFVGSCLMNSCRLIAPWGKQLGEGLKCAITRRTWSFSCPFAEAFLASDTSFTL